MTWTWWGVPGVVVLPISLGLALFLARTLSVGQVNRRLATVLVLEGLSASLTLGFLFYLPDPNHVRVAVALGMCAWTALQFQYLSFLGVAVDTPLVRPFSTAFGRRTLSVMSVLGGVLILLNPQFIVGELYDPGWAPWNFQLTPMGSAIVASYAAMSFFGLIAALSAFLRADRGSSARNQALWFMIAFGFRDAFMAVLLGAYPILRPVPFWGDLVYNPIQALVYLIYQCLLAYAVLNNQLFDLDLKIKFALEKTTLGALIGGGFFVGSELLEGLVPIDSTILGLIVAAVIVAFLRPVERVVSNALGRLLSGVEDSPQYRESRKLRVYRGALEGAVDDGVIHEQERAVLDVLREQLEITTAEAQRLEDDIVGRGGCVQGQV
ncbi:MAG: hypothetical protein AAF389_07400 [Gemmatimonadota bacterium]